MKKFFTLILTILIAGSGMCYGQGKKSGPTKPPTPSQQRRIAQLEKQLADCRNRITELEAMFRERPLTQDEEAFLDATLEEEGLSSQQYSAMLQAWLEYEQKARQDAEEQAIVEALKKALAQRDITVHQDIKNLTSLIYQGQATADQYYDIIKRQTPAIRVQTYKILQHEAKIRELEYKIQQEEQRKTITDLKKKIFESTGYHPTISGKTIAKLPTDPHAYDFINEINADRKRFKAPLLTREEENALMDIRDEASKNYNEADVKKNENKRKFDLLTEGLEDLAEDLKDCEECAELLKTL